MDEGNNPFLEDENDDPSYDYENDAMLAAAQHALGLSAKQDMATLRWCLGWRPEIILTMSLS